MFTDKQRALAGWVKESLSKFRDEQEKDHQAYMKRTMERYKMFTAGLISVMVSNMDLPTTSNSESFIRECQDMIHELISIHILDKHKAKVAFGKHLNSSVHWSDRGDDLYSRIEVALDTVPKRLSVSDHVESPPKKQKKSPQWYHGCDEVKENK